MDTYPFPVFFLKHVSCYFPFRYIYCAAVRILNVGKVTGINRITQRWGCALGTSGSEGAHIVSTGHVAEMEIYCSPRSLGIANGKGKRDYGN